MNNALQPFAAMSGSPIGVLVVNSSQLAMYHQDDDFLQAIKFPVVACDDIYINCITYATHKPNVACESLDTREYKII